MQLGSGVLSALLFGTLATYFRAGSRRGEVALVLRLHGEGVTSGHQRWLVEFRSRGERRGLQIVFRSVSVQLAAGDLFVSENLQILKLFRLLD